MEVIQADVEIGSDTPAFRIDKKLHQILYKGKELERSTLVDPRRRRSCRSRFIR